MDAVRYEAPQRLAERRRHRSEGDQRADQRVVEVELEDQQRQERREEALIGVAGEVSEGEEREPRCQEALHP
jgi:hypothetical protein